MSMRSIHGPQGPSPAEVRMLEVWDVFDLLLRIKPADAQKMAYEAAELAEKYAPQQPAARRRVHPLKGTEL